MSNRRSNNGNNDSSEDEFEGESQHHLNHSAPWHGVAPLEDPNLHPHHLHSHHRHFDYNHPPIVDTYPTPQHSLVPAAATPGTASSGASAGLPFPSFGPARLKQEEEDDNDDESDEDRKPAAREDRGGEEEAKDPSLSHPRRNHSISNDPYVDPSVGLSSFDDVVDEGTHGPFGVAGYNAAEEYELQESAGFAYAAPAPMYAPPVRQAYPPSQRPSPHLSFVIGGGNRFDQQQPHQRAGYSPATRAHVNAVTSNPSVARLPSPPENVARLPPREEPHHRPALPRAAHHGFGPPPPGGFQPTEAELAAAPTPRARKAIFTWYERLNELIEYKEEHGDCVVPQKYEENRQLGIVSSAVLEGYCRFCVSPEWNLTTRTLPFLLPQWVNKQRMEKKFLDDDRKTSMTPERKALLEKIGFQWAKRKGNHSWYEKYNELIEYKRIFGNCDVATKFGPNPALGRWVSTQRSEYKKFHQSARGSKHMTQEKIDKLDRIGFKWEMLPSRSSSDED